MFSRFKVSSKKLAWGVGGGGGGGGFHPPYHIGLSYPSLAIMSIVAMESQCMKTIMIHLVDKSNFILSDHETSCKSLQNSC